MKIIKFKNRASLKEQFIVGMVLWIGVVIISIIGVFVMINSLPNSSDIELWKYISYIICIVAVVFTIIFLIITQIIPYFKDLKNCIRENYLNVTGKVIGFEKNENPDSGDQIDCIPIIQTETGEKITLSVNEFLDIGKTYTFNYLKHTKLAEVKKEINKT